MSKIDLKRDMEKRLKNKLGRKAKRDAKLQELEKQLQFAESRCGTLKQQLDYIKLLYGCRNFSEIPIQSSYDTSSRGGGDNVDYFNCRESNKWTVKPESLGKKEDGDCPDLSNQIVSHSNTTCTISNSSKKRNSIKEGEERSGSHVRGHLKLQKVKKRNPKKTKKRRRVGREDVAASASKFSNVSSQTRSQIWQDPLVEIYKNAAVNAESESGLEVLGTGQKKPKKTIEILSEVKKAIECHEGSRSWGREKTEQPEMEPAKSKGSSNASKKTSNGKLKEEGIQTEISLEGLMAAPSPKAEEFNKNLTSLAGKSDGTFFETVKSYCQPTISSKRKQVERDIYSTFNSINVRSIPFIAAKSTTPSHNIGVNIQQVLSIIKKRHHHVGGGENLINSSESGVGCSEESRTATLCPPKKVGYNDCERISEGSAAPTTSSQSKKRSEAVSKSSLSHWISTSDFGREKTRNPREIHSGETKVDSGLDWSLKVDKLKKVLVFLHEDFTCLSQKYKKLQKKLTKRNITKADAKGELGEIERDLEKKEEEITVVIGLYKEVLSLREDLKQLRDKYNLASSGKAFVLDGLKQSSSAHTQMTTLLRKIQHFQDQLKG